jgi:hypothetical protein
MVGVITAGLSLRGAQSMRSESSSVLGVLQGLEQQVGAYHRHAMQVAAAIRGGHLVLAREAADALLRVLDAIVQMTTKLQPCVVPIDGLGEVMESLPELAIRARRMVISTQADVLRDVLRGPVAEGRTRGWFCGRFRHIDHVSDFLTNEFYRINCLWMQYRCDDRRAARMAIAYRVTLYETALRVAQQAMQELGADPALAHFLKNGMAASDWPEVQAACVRIAAALAIQIDLKPSRQRWGQLPALNKADAAPARKS